METHSRSRSPLYIQLREVIRSRIDEGEYLPGTCIPSESQLSEGFGLNRIAVRSALEALENEGLLKSVQGKGVFVVGPKLERDLEKLGGFRQTMRERDQNPSTRVLVKALRKAGPLYAQILKIDDEDEIWYIKRICISNDEPVALEEIYIPSKIVPGFADVDIGLFSIFDVYQWNDVRIKRGEQKLAISHLDPAAARLIGIGENNAVIEFSGVVYDENDKIVEFSRSYTKNEKCEYIVHFKK